MGRYVGKIVFEVFEDDIVFVILYGVVFMLFWFDVIYFIVGGSGGLGWCIVEWMVCLGVKNIVFFFWFGEGKCIVKEFMVCLWDEGVCVVVMVCDVG